MITYLYSCIILQPHLKMNHKIAIQYPSNISHSQLPTELKNNQYFKIDNKTYKCILMNSNDLHYCQLEVNNSDDVGSTNKSDQTNNYNDNISNTQSNISTSPILISSFFWIREV